MRHRHFLDNFVLFLALVVLCESSFAAGCPEKTAFEAEARADGIESIEQARIYFHAYRRCLDGPIAYGFINRLAELASRAEGIDELWNNVKSDSAFRAAVLKYLPSEAVPLDLNNQVLRNLEARCPREARSFCAHLTKQIRKVCTECKP